MRQLDMQHHTYADYLAWSATYGNEVIDGIAYVREPSAPKLRVFERAGVPEVWLIAPTDRTVTIYRIADGQYGPPVVLELRGQTAITAVAGVTIDRDYLPAM